MKGLKRVRMLIVDAVWLVSLLAAGLLTVGQLDLASGAWLIVVLFGLAIVSGA